MNKILRLCQIAAYHKYLFLDEQQLSKIKNRTF